MSRSAAVLAAVVSVMLAVAAPTSNAAEEWAWPVRGSVITSYSNDNSRPYAGGMHRGIDISASVGASVAAARAGKVTYSGTLGSSGLTLAIETSDARYVTSYLHLSSVAVKRGEAVHAGQKVGEVGTSGQRSPAEPHLHFGVRLAGRRHVYIDPLTLLPPRTGSRPEAPASPAPAFAPARLQAQIAPVLARARPVPTVSWPHPLVPPVTAPHAVPAGPRPRPMLRPQLTAPGVPESWGRRPAVREGSPVNWGPLVSLAGIGLLGAVLARGLLRSDPSGTSRGENATQPAARAAPVDVAQIGPVSQMG